jgi:hypothetical protein
LPIQLLRNYFNSAKEREEKRYEMRGREGQANRIGLHNGAGGGQLWKLILNIKGA